jgi:hypothetical protein
MARKKNRKRQPAQVVFPAPLAATLVVAAVLALSYLWLCGRCENLGREIRDLERSLSSVKVRAQTEAYKWSNLTSPRQFEEILRRHGLDMTWPEEDRVVRLRASSLRHLHREVRETYQLVQSAPVMRHD